MKSTVLVSEKKGKITLREIDLNDPEENEIQIRVHASVISPGTERAFVLNMENTTGVFPMYPGYSSAGVVEKLGPNVTKFKVGDRVACHGVSHRAIGNVTQNQAVKIPDNIPFSVAAFTSLGVIALQGVRKARVELAETGLVFGLGLIGQLSLKLLKLNGALPVIGVDRLQNRIDLARECGADITFNSSNENWREKLSIATKGNGPEVVVECTGMPEVISTALQLAGLFARVVILSSTRGDSNINFYRDVHKKALTIIGAHISGNPKYDSRPGFWAWQDDAGSFLKLLEHKRIVLDPLITNRTSWMNVETLYQGILDGDPNVLGVVINWV